MNIDEFKKTFQFSSDSNAPLYEQLAMYIKINIQNGTLKPGDQMIAETSLCDILKISRTTVRQCMNQLVEQGLLVRFRGKGSFIASPKIRRNINYMYNFTENIRSAGAQPTSVVLQQKVIHANAQMTAVLQLPIDHEKAFLLERLRCANQDPMLLETTCVPYHLCPEIESLNFETNSLYSTLSDRYSLDLYHAVETIESILIDEASAELLKCGPKSPGYRIERISYLGSGQIFEFTTSITRADKCVFRLDLYKNSASNKNTVDFERRLNFI